MALLLHRLGGFSARHRRLVVVGWLVVLLAVGSGAVRAGSAYTDEFSIPGSESSAAQEVLAEEFPQASGVSVQIVLAAPDGSSVTDPAYAPAVAESLAAVAEVGQVEQVTDPAARVSQDGSTALAVAATAVTAADLDPTTLDAVDAAVEPAREAGLDVQLGGSAFGGAPEAGNHLAEAAGVAIALLVLLITFSSLVAAGLPLLTAVLCVGVTLGGVVLFSNLTTTSTTAPTLALMIGLAVGIDYALFVLSRHRHQLANGVGVTESVARATGTSGTAVVFAGVTVVIALLGLAVVGIPFLTTMGVAAAAAVVVSVLGAVVLLPAVLAIAGERLRPREGSRAWRREQEVGAGGRTGLVERWTAFCARRGVPVLLLSVIGLGAVAVPAADLALALPTNGSSAEDSSQRIVHDTLEEEFGAGTNGPLLVLADLADARDPQAATTAVGQRLVGTDGVATVAPPQLSQDGRTALFQVVPTTGPSDPATADLVETVRAESDDVAAATGATLTVGGVTATQTDVSQTLGDALVPYALVVVGLSFVLLVAVFRSVAVPLKAALGFLLSVAAALGATVAVFQWGWAADLLGVAALGPVVSFMPIMLLAVLFGLAMDYEVFLVSRVRESYVHGSSARQAVADGGRHAGRVVVAAALIMIGVFSSFVFTDNATLQPIAFALAVGVLIDALVVRLTIVPAVLGLLGRSAWWIPRWLDRILPELDVEGASLPVALPGQRTEAQPAHR